MPTVAETWIEQGRQQGIEQGLNNQRVLLRRLVYRRFGEGAAEQLTPWLEKIHDADQLTQMAEWVIECDTSEVLLRRVRESMPLDK